MQQVEQYGDQSPYKDSGNRTRNNDRAAASGLGNGEKPQNEGEVKRRVLHHPRKCHTHTL